MRMTPAKSVEVLMCYNVAQERRGAVKKSAENAVAAFSWSKGGKIGFKGAAPSGGGAREGGSRR